MSTLPERRLAKRTAEINTLDDIISDLRELTKDFPEAAVEAAIEQKEKIIPLLIKLLEETLQDYEKLSEQNFFGHLFALFLLASFREKNAFSLAIKIASLPGDWPEQLLGDSITEDLHRILASLYNGNLTELLSLIENPNACQWSRSSALQTLLLLVKENILEREWVISYLRGLFHHPIFTADDQETSRLVSIACDIYPEELYDEIQEAFEANRVDPMWLNKQWVDEHIAEGKEACLAFHLYHNPHMTLIDDVIKEMKYWLCFREETDQPEPLIYGNDDLVWGRLSPPSLPYQRDTPKIGRNDPCPCGSGKKYKKCCLNN